jgi:8-oxo-dGTP pyrophosphatase MutT (NUDIX family)
MPSYISWLRQRVGRQKMPLVFASACIADDKGRLLWQRRSDFGYWGLPGGALELGESLPQCVAREVREETGLSVQPVRLAGIYSSPSFDVTYPNGDQAQPVVFCFECRAKHFQTQGDGDETLELAWFEAGQWPGTAPSFVLMANDGVSGCRAASFLYGAPSNGASDEPFFQRLRRYIGHERWIMPGAAAVIRDEAGRVLLQRRGDTGEWGLPAGAMELGERLDQTVIREIQEETGLEIEPLRVVGVYSGADFNFSYPNGDHVKAVSTLFECRVTGGSLKADGVESLEVRFFSVNDLPPLAPRHHRRIADALAGREEAVF